MVWFYMTIIILTGGNYMFVTVKGMRQTNILVAKGLYHDKFFTCLIG